MGCVGECCDGLFILQNLIALNRGGKLTTVAGRRTVNVSGKDVNAFDAVAAIHPA